MSTTARPVATVVLGTAGLAAAYMIATRPPLRRLAFRAMRFWLGASVPGYLLDQTRRAWVESARRSVPD